MYIWNDTSYMYSSPSLLSQGLIFPLSHSLLHSFCRQHQVRRAHHTESRYTYPRIIYHVSGYKSLSYRWLSSCWASGMLSQQFCLPESTRNVQGWNNEEHICTQNLSLHNQTSSIVHTKTSIGRDDTLLSLLLDSPRPLDQLQRILHPPSSFNPHPLYPLACYSDNIFRKHVGYLLGPRPSLCSNEPSISSSEFSLPPSPPNHPHSRPASSLQATLPAIQLPTPDSRPGGCRYLFAAD